MDPQETRRRIRAARVLADVTVEQLAAKLGAGLGSKTLGMIERGERDVHTRELRDIAAACGLPYEFFTADLDRLPELTSQEPARRVRENFAAERASWQVQMEGVLANQTTMAEQLTGLRAAVVALAAGNLQLTREQLGLDEKGRSEPRPEEGD